MDVSFFFYAGAVMTVNYTADVGPGVLLGAGVQPSDWLSVAIEPRVLIPSRAIAKDPVDPSKPVLGTHELDVSDVSVLLVPCVHYWYFLGCPVAQLGGNIHKSSRTLTTAISYSFGPRLGFRFPFLDRFAVQAFGEALFVPDPSRVEFPDLNAIWSQPVVSGFLGATFSMKIE